MLLPALALFALAAVIGVYMLTRVFAGALPPWLAAILHGAFAATGLVLLLYSAFGTGVSAPPVLMFAAVVLVIAALGGFVLVSFHLRKQVPPRGLALVHGLAAVAGFLATAASAFGLA